MSSPFRLGHLFHIIIVARVVFILQINYATKLQQQFFESGPVFTRPYRTSASLRILRTISDDIYTHDIQGRGRAGHRHWPLAHIIRPITLQTQNLCQSQLLLLRLLLHGIWNSDCPRLGFTIQADFNYFNREKWEQLSLITKLKTYRAPS